MRRKNNESGAILLIVIIFMLALTITGLAFLSSTVMEYRLAMREVHKNQAFYLADGGIEHLRVRLSVLGGHQAIKDKTELSGGCDGDGMYRPAVDGRHNFKLALGEGGYWVEYYEKDPPSVDYAISIGQVIKEGAISDEDIGEVITGGEIIVQRKIRIELYETPLFDYAVFGDEWVTVGGNSLIDSVGEIGKIGTNGTAPGSIQVTGSGEVNANVYVGAGADPNTVIVGTENINGATDSLEQPIEWPAVVEPTGLDVSSVPLNVSPSEDIPISGGWEYPSIDIKGILRIPAGTSCILLADTVEMSAGGEIIIEDGVNPAHLEIYVREYARLGGHGITNVGQDPTQCQIYGIGECFIEFDGTEDFYGTIYAPDGEIRCRGDAEITGSVIGNTVDISGNPKILWDPILATGGPTKTSLRNWQEIS